MSSMHDNDPYMKEIIIEAEPYPEWVNPALRWHVRLDDGTYQQAYWKGAQYNSVEEAFNAPEHDGWVFLKGRYRRIEKPSQ